MTASGLWVCKFPEFIYISILNYDYTRVNQNKLTWYFFCPTKDDYNYNFGTKQV